MDERTRIAHHEAAHAVIALLFGIGLPDRGIDLDAENQQTGGLGNAAANLWQIDDLRSLTGEELEAAQKGELTYARHNLMTLLAGAASDAKVLGEALPDALAEQTSDHAKAVEILERLAVPPDEHEESILNMLHEVAEAINEPEIWDAIAAVAKSVLIDGRVSGPEIEEQAAPKIAAWRDRSARGQALPS